MTDADTQRRLDKLEEAVIVHGQLLDILWQALAVENPEFIRTVATEIVVGRQLAAVEADAETFLREDRPQARKLRSLLQRAKAPGTATAT